MSIDVVEDAHNRGLSKKTNGRRYSRAGVSLLRWTDHEVVDRPSCLLWRIKGAGRENVKMSRDGVGGESFILEKEGDEDRVPLRLPARSTPMNGWLVDEAPDRYQRAQDARNGVRFLLRV